MSAPLIWLVIGLLLALAEVISGEFVLLMLGGGALAAAGASLLVAGPVVGGVVFAVVSVLLVFVARPALRRRLEKGMDDTPMGPRALLGVTAIVVSRVDGHGGQVKIRGELWSARSSDGTEVIEPDTQVTVVRIDGATAEVATLG